MATAAAINIRTSDETLSVADVDFSQSVLQFGAQSSLKAPRANPYKSLDAERIGLDGGIGVGKSTLIRGSVEEIREHGGHAEGRMEHPNNEMRQIFYANKDQEAFSFQMHMLGRRQWVNEESLIGCGRHPKYQPKGPVATQFDDRTMAGDWIFAAEQRAAGRFSVPQWQAYGSTYRELTPYTYDKLALVDASPEASKARVDQRKEAGDVGIPVEYLQGLRRSHYLQYRAIGMGGQVPVLFVNNERFVEPAWFLKRLVRMPSTQQTVQLWQAAPALGSKATPEEVQQACGKLTQLYDRHFEHASVRG